MFWCLGCRREKVFGDRSRLISSNKTPGRRWLGGIFFVKSCTCRSRLSLKSIHLSTPCRLKSKYQGRRGWPIGSMLIRSGAFSISRHINTLSFLLIIPPIFTKPRLTLKGVKTHCFILSSCVCAFCKAKYVCGSTRHINLH